jgi:nicotinate phosphoribosyltransferase
MAYGYWKSGMADHEAVFNLFFRKNPFQGGFSVNCGLQYVVDYINSFSFTDDDIEYLSTIEGPDGKSMFEKEFLDYLSQLNLTLDVDGIEEGRVFFPNQPLVRVKGPIIQTQLMETPLLNLVNFQVLIATKACRVVMAARGESVLEFGLRRAHGVDGGLTASRAAYIGGCSSTSNVLAGKTFGIPVSGTHAHSWVMSFENEIEAFKAYAKALPENCVFLVDTYDTLDGVNHAIEIGKLLRSEGKEMRGIRIDSGDLAYFSIEARKLLDDAGFRDAKIFASNDLDEHLIASLKQQEAAIGVWGVGTKLVTAFDQPALGGVYKLSAIKKDGVWIDKIKLSEQSIKINIPGFQQVRRFFNENKFSADMIYDERNEPDGKQRIIDPADHTKRKTMDPDKFESEDLLKPIFRRVEQLYEIPDLQYSRNRLQDDLKKLDRSIRRFVNPHIYPVGLEEGLYHNREELIMKLRNKKQ